MKRGEVRGLLDEVDEGRVRARRSMDPYLGGWLLIWGTVYLVGYTLEAAGSPLAQPAWAVLTPFGLALSYALGLRIAGYLRTQSGRAMGALWAGFGVVFLALVIAGSRLFGEAFSLAANLLVGLALWESGVLLSRPLATATGAAFALLNGLFYAYLPGLYNPALAAAGLLAAIAGLRLIRHGLR